VFDQLVTSAHRLRDLAPHRNYRSRLVSPAVAAQAMRVGHMQRHAHIAVKGLQLGNGGADRSDLAQRNEFREGQVLEEILRGRVSSARQNSG
jgi:hypothetical protein